MSAERTVLLTFDHEEFDMPFEYKSSIPFDEQIEVSRTGVKGVKNVLDSYNIATTFFVTATYALNNTEEIKLLSEKHEISSHTFYHSAYKEEHLLQSKQTLEQITGKPVQGLRMPRMKQPSLKAVKQAGYLYDSSVNPTFLPGRYNHLNKPRTLFTEDDLLRLPASVTPMLRIPLFWLMFKNIPLSLFKRMAFTTLKNDGSLSLYLHPWEFANLTNYKIPGYTKKIDGEQLLERLSNLVIFLKNEASFLTISQYIEQNNLQNKK